MKLLLTITTTVGLLVLPATAGEYSMAPSTSLTSDAPISLSDGNWVPLLQKGTKEFSIGGVIDWEDFEDLEYNLQVSYGWFIADGWEFGLTGSFSDQNDVRNITAGIFTEYNFNRDSQWVPFIGASAEYGLGDFGDIDDAISDLDDSVDSIVFGGELGIKYFFRPNIAISTSIQFNWSPDELYAVDDELKDAATRFLIGMRFYF